MHSRDIMLFCQPNWAKRHFSMQNFEFASTKNVREFYQLNGVFSLWVCAFFLFLSFQSFSQTGIFLLLRKKNYKNFSEKNNEHNFFDFAQIGVFFYFIYIFIFFFWKNHKKFEGEDLELQIFVFKNKINIKPKMTSWYLIF